MSDSKNSRAQSRLEKAAREGANAWVDYEVQAKAVREKTARLRALRLAKEAADRSAGIGEGVVVKKAAKKAAKKAVKPG